MTTYALRLIPHTSNEHRLLYALLLAVAVHALLIFSVVFDDTPPLKNHRQSLPSLDITLVVPNDSQTPDKADYLAQSDQDSQQDKPEEHFFIAEESAPRTGAQNNNAHIPSRQQPLSDSPEQAKNLDSIISHEASPFTRHASAFAINHLISDNDALTQEHAQKQGQTLRHKYIVRSKKEVEAAYWAKWQNSVETLGTENFSRLLQQQHIYGQVTIDISLNPDGSLYGFEIIRSDHPLLTTEVKKLIQLATPFDPIPKELLELADIFHIKRSWLFENPNAY